MLRFSLRARHGLLTIAYGSEAGPAHIILRMTSEIFQAMAAACSQGLQPEGGDLPLVGRRPGERQ